MPANKEYLKQYRLANKKRLKDEVELLQAVNKEVYSNRSKKCYAKNPAKYIERSKAYYQKNKEAIRAKIRAKVKERKVNAPKPTINGLTLPCLEIFFCFYR